MQTDDQLTILDSAVDWLTVTAKRGSAADQLIARAQSLLHQAECAGNRVLPFRASGYRGWRCAGVTYGQRKDGAILSTSSGEAALNWSSLIREDYHVTRLDLQITCFDNSANVNRAEDAYRSLQAGHKKNGRPITSSLRLNSGGGHSLYLGHPTSDVIGRMYDKGIEKKIAPAGECQRYEVQYRREPAERTANAVYQSEAVHDCIAALVTHYFSNRGVVVPPLERAISNSELLSQSYYLSKRETDDLRSLKWLSTFVASTVKRLVDSGRRADVLRALNLEE